MSDVCGKDFVQMIYVFVPSKSGMLTINLKCIIVDGIFVLERNYV